LSVAMHNTNIQVDMLLNNRTK